MSSTLIAPTYSQVDSGRSDTAPAPALEQLSAKELFDHMEEFIRINLADHAKAGFLPLPALKSKPHFSMAGFLDEILRANVSDVLYSLGINVEPSSLSCPMLVNPFTNTYQPTLAWNTDALTAYYPTFLVTSSNLPDVLLAEPTLHREIDVPCLKGRVDTAELAAINSDFTDLVINKDFKLQLIIDHRTIKLYIVPNESQAFRNLREQCLLDSHSDHLMHLLLETIDSQLQKFIAAHFLDKRPLTVPSGVTLNLGGTIGGVHAIKDGIETLIELMPTSFKLRLLSEALAERSQKTGLPNTGMIKFFSYANPGTNTNNPAYFPDLKTNALPLARLIRGGLDRHTKKANPDLLVGKKTSLDILSEKVAACKYPISLVHMKDNSISIRISPK